MAKVRYRQADQAVIVTPLADGRARLEFDLDQRAVTPGQYAVLYQGTRCLGGGIIETTSG
jgi:tRNA-specific 2-thiouridylase